MLFETERKAEAARLEEDTREEKLKKDNCKPKEDLTLEPYHRGHAVVVGDRRFRVSDRIALMRVEGPYEAMISGWSS